jgi:hypothetical protein
MEIENNDIDDNHSDDFDFETVKSKSKRTHLDISPSSPKILNKKNISNFASNNKFAVLSTNDSDVNTTNKTTINNTIENDETRIPSPLPIFVRNIDNFFTFRNKLINLIGTLNFTFKATANNLKINSNNSDLYRVVIKYLNEKKREFYIYKAQENEACRVVFRDLHPSTPNVEIGAAVQDMDFLVRQASYVLQKTTKHPLPLFFIDLEPAENNKEIFSTNNLLHTKIKVEEPHMLREIIQCFDIRNMVIPNPIIHNLQNASIVLLLTQPHHAPNPKNNHQPLPYIKVTIRQATVAVQFIRTPTFTQRKYKL